MFDRGVQETEHRGAGADSERGGEEKGRMGPEKNMDRALEREARERLDDATVEPRSFVEGRADYRQAESIQRDFSSVTDSFSARGSEVGVGRASAGDAKQAAKELSAEPAGQERLFNVHAGGDGDEGSRPPSDSDGLAAGYRADAGTGGGSASDGDDRGVQANVAMGIGGIASDPEEGGPQANVAMGVGGVASDDEEGGPQANVAMGIGSVASDPEEGGPEANVAMGPGGVASDDEEGGPQANVAMGLGDHTEEVGTLPTPLPRPASQATAVSEIDSLGEADSVAEQQLSAQQAKKVAK
jgi:hypothetical protein